MEKKIGDKASGAKELMILAKVPDISREKLPPTGGGSGPRYETLGGPEKTHSHPSIGSQPPTCSQCTLSVAGCRGHPGPTSHAAVFPPPVAYPAVLPHSNSDSLA